MPFYNKDYTVAKEGLQKSKLHKVKKIRNNSLNCSQKIICYKFRIRFHDNSE